ncbi:MAG: glutamate ligase domain-containing protein, partial [Candidatus Limnocylindrales bacterium]
RAEDVASLGFEGMRFRLVTPDGEREVAIARPGRIGVHNALAAAAAGLAAGMTLGEIVPGLATGGSAPHRSTLIRAGGVTIVDDSYNASPGSMLAALDMLAGLPGRRVALLGHMLELGAVSESGHAAVGAAVARTADLLIVAAGAPGGEAAGIADAALAAGMAPEAVVRAASRRDAADEAARRLQPGDVVLVKASQGIGLEEPVRDRLGVGLEVLIADLVDRLGGGAVP